MTDSSPTDRRGLEVLSHTECEEMLSRTLIGRIGVLSAGEPLILPVTFAYSQGAVVFRTSPGKKLDAVWVNTLTAFEIDDWECRPEPVGASWSAVGLSTFTIGPRSPDSKALDLHRGFPPCNPRRGFVYAPWR